MATILDSAKCSKIKDIRKKIDSLELDGWLCEGTDQPGYPANVFFNNDLDESFIADYNGQILSSSVTDMNWKLQELARLTGQISRICYG